MGCPKRGDAQNAVTPPLGKRLFRKVFFERYIRCSSDDQKTSENDDTETENYFLSGGYLQSRPRAFVCLVQWN